MKKPCGLCFILLFFPSWMVLAQEELKSFVEKALEIHVMAKIYVTGAEREEMIVNIEKVKFTTIPGRSVSIQYRARNILIKAVFTVYQDSMENWFLVVQGHIWFHTSESDENALYYSSIQTVPFKIDDTIIFYPLGISDSDSKESVYNIELAIKIQYVSSVDAGESEILSQK